MAEPWAPSLADVGRIVPTRTRDVRTPGSDSLLGTFTPATTPTDAQAQATIDTAVGWVVGEAGDSSAWPAGDQITQQARTAASYRAASDIEMAYPARDADIRTAIALDLRAKDALASLQRALASGGAPVDVLPYWAMPDPPLWSDINL
jgi:hypothetical protein